MNTKTMRHPPRRVTDSMPNNNSKRKKRDGLDLEKLTPPPPTKPPMLAAAAAHPVLHNQLLAGYLAHEFLTRGTLFGQPWDSTRPLQTTAESRRAIGGKAEPRERSATGDAEPDPEPKLREENKRQRYVEVARLLKTDGTHVPGIVNPSQLSRFLEM
ncbi:Polyadenylate-binding protein 2-binding protein 2 [Hibiscus syriacus]|uniref:Polyadenylate-binding protein 2-binding protein 2 n=2 Tax=Hibiscus syriacus TaxID=106335 RepID=A0A6A3CU27_HIBSY|nr:Polyadenylate-binding protein 2-binding protein 2 [Hibiscus syriacus]